jgi:4-hydroxyacetophenone monooxygenase
MRTAPAAFSPELTEVLMKNTQAADYADDPLGVSDAFVREALQQADPNVLRLALYQTTRDPELAAMRTVKRAFWGGTYELPALADEHVDAVRQKAWEYVSHSPESRTETTPDEADLRAMMDMFYGEPVSDFFYRLGRGDLVEDEFPLGVEWNDEPPAEIKSRFKIAVIGAGIGGLATAIQLDRLGLPYVVLERNDGVGGTWRINNYPEARVDIASHHYQYSFMKKYPWKHYFATQEELLAYLEEVESKYGLGPHIRYNTEVVEATWDDRKSVWNLVLKTGDGRQDLQVNAIISAAGLFNKPNIPDIPGIESFRGKMFHTTRWDHSYDYSGKKIGQIGVGSSGAQLMPALARSAAHLTVYQRSPQWVSPVEGYHAEVSKEVQWLFDNFPHYWGWFSFFMFSVACCDPDGIQSRDPEWQKAGGIISRRNDALRENNIAYMESKIGHRPELLKKLIPDFPPFAKRPVVDNGWFDALNQDNVELVLDPIVRITPDGVLSADGIERKFDLLVLSSGFTVERYVWPTRYLGRDGRSLEEFWERDGARSYLGLTVPHFPNLFLLYGPNGQARAGGLFKWLEIWARYSVSAIVELIESGGKSIEVKPEVFEDYNVRMDEAEKLCIWEMVKSYYVNKHGRQQVSNPWLPHTYFPWVEKPEMADFIIRP